METGPYDMNYNYTSTIRQHLDLIPIKIMQVEILFVPTLMISCVCCNV